jgi:hypothetical protein
VSTQDSLEEGDAVDLPLELEIKLASG